MRVEERMNVAWSTKGLARCHRLSQTGSVVESSRSVSANIPCVSTLSTIYAQLESYVSHKQFCRYGQLVIPYVGAAHRNETKVLSRVGSWIPRNQVSRTIHQF
jgi:hypothetical protein